MTARKWQGVPTNSMYTKTCKVPRSAKSCQGMLSANACQCMAVTIGKTQGSIRLKYMEMNKYEG